MAAEARAPGLSYICWPRFITLKGPAALSVRGGEGRGGVQYTELQHLRLEWEAAPRMGSGGHTLDVMT